MAIQLPDLSDYNVNVTPYQGLKEISRIFGLGAGFGGADYIAARQAGYTDPQIVSFLKANPYLNTGVVMDYILQGKQADLISGGLPNLNKSDTNRKALVDPNASTSTKVPYADYTVAGRGGAPSVQMSNANVNVSGNDSYNQLMNASQSGSLLMVKNPPQNNLFGQSYDPGTYKLIDSYTGDIVASNVSPSQQKGVYQFSFSNPQSEGSVNAYIRADPTTGAVGAIDPSKNLSYQSGMGGGMLSGIAGMALPVLAGLALPGIGNYLGAALSGFTEADALANLATFAPAGSSVITAEGAIPAAYSAAGTAAAAAPSLYSQAANLYNTVANNPIVQTAKEINTDVNLAKGVLNGDPNAIVNSIAKVDNLVGSGAPSTPVKLPDNIATQNAPTNLSDLQDQTNFDLTPNVPIQPEPKVSVAQNGSTEAPTFTTDGTQAGTTTDMSTQVGTQADTAPEPNPNLNQNTAQNGSTGTPTFQDNSGKSQIEAGVTSNYADNTKTTTYVDPNTGNVTNQYTQSNAFTPTQGTAIPGTTPSTTPSTTQPTSTLSSLKGLTALLGMSTGVAGLSTLLANKSSSSSANKSSSSSANNIPAQPTMTDVPLQFDWGATTPAAHSYGEVMGQQYLNPMYTPAPIAKAQGGLASIVNNTDHYPTDAEAKAAFNAAHLTPSYEKPQEINQYTQSLMDLMRQMHLLPDNSVIPSPEQQHAAVYGGAYAHGGEIYSLGSYSDGGRLLKGPGDGMSDNIPATIGHNQPARLADGEFVIPADVVSHLGNGSTEAGSKVLYQMMERVRKARTGNPKQGKQIKADKFVPV